MKTISKYEFKKRGGNTLTWPHKERSLKAIKKLKIILANMEMRPYSVPASNACAVAQAIITACWGSPNPRKFFIFIQILKSLCVCYGCACK